MLSKYHAIFLPAGTVLLLVLHRPLRRWLTRPGPYLAIGAGPAGLQPGDRLEREQRLGLVPVPGRASGGGARAQARLPGRRACWPRRVTSSPGSGSRSCCSWSGDVRTWRPAGEPTTSGSGSAWRSCPSVIFTAVACFRPVLPHWGLIGLVSLFPLLGDAWARQLESRPGPTRRGLAMAAALLAGDPGADGPRASHRLPPARRQPAVGTASTPGPTRPATSTAGTRSPTGSSRSGCSTTPAPSCSRGCGTRAPSSPTPFASSVRSSATTSTTPAASPSGASPRTGWGTTASSLLINDEFVPVPFYRRWFEDVRTAGGLHHRAGRQAVPAGPGLPARPSTGGFPVRLLARAGGRPRGDQVRRPPDGPRPADSPRDPGTTARLPRALIAPGLAHSPAFPCSV